MMDYLHSLLKPVFTKQWFQVFFSSIMWANPIVIFPQVYIMLTVTTDGVSAVTWLAFAFIQLALAIQGIQTKNISQFLTMTASMFGSITVVLLVLFR